MVPGHPVAATGGSRHITLDRAMWGSDQSASVEPQGLARLVGDVRVISEAMGDGVKRIYDGERAAMKSSAECPLRWPMLLIWWLRRDLLRRT